MNGLVCLGKMLEHLDKYAVLDDILPLMNQIPSREPPTLMAILGEVDLKTSMGMELRFGKNPPLRILFFAFVSSDNTRLCFDLLNYHLNCICVSVSRNFQANHAS